MDNVEFYQDVDLVVTELKEALSSIDAEQTERFVQLIFNAQKVYFIGVGRVMLALQCFAKRLAHLGFDVHCVGEITEPAITDRDILIVGSGSGESIIPLNIARKAHSLGARIIHIGSNPNSSMKSISELMVRIPVRTKLQLEDEIASEQPMTTLFEQTLMIWGDVVALGLIKRKKIDLENLWQLHANLE